MADRQSKAHTAHWAPYGACPSKHGESKTATAMERATRLQSVHKVPVGCQSPLVTTQTQSGEERRHIGQSIIDRLEANWTEETTKPPGLIPKLPGYHLPT